MNATENQAAAHEQHYRTLLALLPDTCCDRLDLATVGAWRAIYGNKPTLIARTMKRSYWWVRLRLTWLDRILKPYLDSDDA